jgi:hypothetical protein
MVGPGLRIREDRSLSALGKRPLGARKEVLR